MTENMFLLQCAKLFLSYRYFKKFFVVCNNMRAVNSFKHLKRSQKGAIVLTKIRVEFQTQYLKSRISNNPENQSIAP